MRTGQWVCVRLGVLVGGIVKVAKGNFVAVRVEVMVGVRVGVRLGHLVSVGRVPVNVGAGEAVKVGGSGVSEHVSVAVGRSTFVADGVELSVMPARLPPGLSCCWIALSIPTIPISNTTPPIKTERMTCFGTGCFLTWKHMPEGSGSRPTRV